MGQKAEYRNMCVGAGVTEVRSCFRLRGLRQKSIFKPTKKPEFRLGFYRNLLEGWKGVVAST